MNTKVNVPPPSTEELALRTSEKELLDFQRGVLQDQLARQELLDPIMFEALGLIPEVDDDGNIISFSKEEDPNEALRTENETALLERQRDALAGDLPVSPALEREIEDQGKTLRERLQRQLGPGFESSSPGIEALQIFEQRSLELREGARTGQISLATQLGIAQGTFNEGSESNNLSNVLGLSGSPLGAQAGLSNTAAGFNRAGGAFTNDRNMQLQASIANANNSPLSAVFSGLGMFAGLAFA